MVGSKRGYRHRNTGVEKTLNVGVKEEFTMSESKPKPEEIELSAEEGEKLVARLAADELSPEDRQLLAKIVPLFISVVFSLREAKMSIGRLKELIFGQKRRRGKRNRGERSDEESESEPGKESKAAQEQEEPVSADETEQKVALSEGHGRYGAEVYSGAQTMRVEHQKLKAGDRCPNGPCGRLYALSDRVTIRFRGEAPLQASRYELERLRCSACQEIFVAEAEAELGEKKYSADAQVMLSLSRYFLGVPFYRLEQFQSMLGMPIADATPFDQTEQVWKALQPVVKELRYEAAQSELIYQDDTSVRILSLLKENDQAPADARVGMYTTALVGCQGARRIVLYRSGRSHAGENLAELLLERESDRKAPLIMSDALAANQSGDLPEPIRCLCLAHGYRKFSDIEHHYPQQTQRVLEDLDYVFDVDRYAREQVRNAWLCINAIAPRCWSA